MRKNVLRILSCFLVVVALSLSLFPAQAVAAEYTSVESFWNWVAGSGDIAQGILSHIPIGSRDNVCANSSDGYHHSNGFTKDGGDGYFLCVCKDCGREFRGYASDIPSAYDNYVSALPAPAYSSGNALRWRLNISSYSNMTGTTVSSFSGGSSFSVQYLAPSSSIRQRLSILVDEFKAPVSGNYHLGCWFSGSSSSPYQIYGNSTSNSTYLFSDSSDLSKFPIDSYSFICLST